MAQMVGRWRPYLHETDEQIVEWAQQGDSVATEYLLYRYRNLVRQVVKPYFMAGAEKEDLLQVGMIGLWRAIMDFKPDRKTAFPVFARVCIQRHILSAVKNALRQQHLPLNTSLLFSTVTEQGLDLVERLPAEGSDLETQLMEVESRCELEQQLQHRLSAFEHQVLQAYCAGKSYQEIAGELQCSKKAIDNALRRIKKKIRKQLE